MRIKRILALTGLAWAITLPPALSTSCSSNGDYEVILNGPEGITFTNPDVKAYMNKDLYIPFILEEGKHIDGRRSAVNVNGTTVDYTPFTTSVGKYWTIIDNNIVIWKYNLQEHRKYNNVVSVYIEFYVP